MGDDLLCTDAPYHAKLHRTRSNGVREKLHKYFYTLQHFGAPRGRPVAKFTNLGDDVYQAAKFRPVLKTTLQRYLLPKFIDFVDGVTDRHTDAHENRK